MRRVFRRTHDLIRLLGTGHTGAVRDAVRMRLSSRATSFGLRRDLRVSFGTPPARIPLTIRPIAPEDDLSFLDASAPGLTGEAVYARLAQRRLLDADLPTCWVAIAPSGKVCYMQWLIAARHNDRLAAHYGDLFPRLGPDEALLEGAYTDEMFRGQGIMAHAMARIAEEARNLGARWIVTFVNDHNIASLKGCKKAGFVPYLLRRESWCLMRRRIRFTALPEGTPYPFDVRETA